MPDSERTVREGIVGYRNYGSDKQEFVRADMENVETLREFLTEMFSGESDITELGKEHILPLLEQGGAQSVMDLGGVRQLDVLNAPQLIDAVRQQVPHEVAMFIHNAKAGGNT